MWQKHRCRLLRVFCFTWMALVLQWIKFSKEQKWSLTYKEFIIVQDIQEEASTLWFIPPKRQVKGRYNFMFSSFYPRNSKPFYRPVHFCKCVLNITFASCLRNRRAEPGSAAGWGGLRSHPSSAAGTWHASTSVCTPPSHKGRLSISELTSVLWQHFAQSHVTGLPGEAHSWAPFSSSPEPGTALEAKLTHVSDFSC